MESFSRLAMTPVNGCTHIRSVIDINSKIFECKTWVGRSVAARCRVAEGWYIFTRRSANFYRGI